MLRRPSISVLLPSSLAVDAPDLRQRTLKVGLVGRTLAIFRVDRVCFYNDDDPKVRDQEAQAKLIMKLLRYLEAPQYLRKHLFPRTRELRYAGVLPPLRTPHHPLRGERMGEGDYREAFVLKVDERGSLLELGLTEKGTVSERLEPGKRLTVRLGRRLGKGRRAVTIKSREEIDEYWGFEVTRAGTLAEAIDRLKASCVIGTSRRGQNLYEGIERIKSNNPSSVAVVFGGPYWGLYEICDRQGVDAGKIFDVMLNTIPRQGTSTVRTEEALTASLALLNVLFGR
ncbi:MAG: RNA methyltransferase [Candidatus Hadarchaeota archaeon]|nr:RNA methyltransferase [Candidatus Hadarchaeota archaeon]